MDFHNPYLSSLIANFEAFKILCYARIPEPLIRFVTLRSFMCISHIKYATIGRRRSIGKNFVIFSEISTSPHVFVFSRVQIGLFWII